MAKKEQNSKPGYGKLLDAWEAPEGAGDPVGCVATSFTFSPAFFEEECLARFLHLESDPTEDGPVYLVEREEKLAQVACAAALVDQHHCRGSRSLRWDLLAARMPSRVLLHAKVSLLYWSKWLRIIIGSANLTEDGYRRNQEVFGVVDYHNDCESPRSVMLAVLDFLRRAAQYSTSAADESPVVVRWNSLLDRAADETSEWGLSEDQARRQSVRAEVVFSGPDYPSVFESLKKAWPSGTPPSVGCVVSPFFDRPEVKNAPAHELWNVLRRRGEATAQYHVAAEEMPGVESLFLHAPASLLAAEPKGRPGAKTEFYRVVLASGRPLHAKGVWLEDSRWSLYQIGSSNFTSAGMGLSKESNLEANLVYIVDGQRNEKALRLLSKSFPESEYIDFKKGVQWKPLSGDGEEEVLEEITLPTAFGEGVYACDGQQQAVIRLSFHGQPPAGWVLVGDADERPFFDEHQWHDRHSPEKVELPWTEERPPSGCWVRWSGSKGSAWWPINVVSGNVLPPPEELKNLPLEVLINILSSARPLHRVLQGYFRRRTSEPSGERIDPNIDPHKRVDTSQFLLQRTRRISWALNALRTRLERPAVTREFLQWRLRGPVGVMALADALVREAKSDDERAFLISELALELNRIRPETAPGCLTPEEHKAEVRAVVQELRALVPEGIGDGPKNLREYVEAVFDAVAV